VLSAYLMLAILVAILIGLIICLSSLEERVERLEQIVRRGIWR
jgi:hypothetical protein